MSTRDKKESEEKTLPKDDTAKSEESTSSKFIKKSETKYSVEVAPDVPEMETEVEKPASENSGKGTEVGDKEEIVSEKVITPSESSVTTPETKPAVTSFSMLDKGLASKEGVEEKKPSILDVQEEVEEVKEDANVEPEETTSASRNDQISSDEVKKWLKDVRPETSVDVETSGGSNFKKVGIIMVLLVLVGLLVGAFFYYKSGSNILPKSLGGSENENNGVTLTETTPTPLLTSTPTPEPVDYSKYNVSVLNGTGIGGEAGRVRTALDPIGFAKITAGNAKTSDYNSTQVSLKEGVPDAVFEKIKETLKDTYVVIMGENTLPDTSSYDVEVIVGVKKS